MHLRGFVHVFENPHHPQDGCGINALAQRLVVEADVAAGDGNLKLLAGFGDAIDGLRKLPHDVRLLGIAEIEAIGCAHGSCARTCHFARRLGDGMHRPQPRIEIAPAPIAIERHRQSALRAFNPNHARIARARRFHRVGLHHVIVLLPHPALAADVGACQKLFEIVRKVADSTQLSLFGHLARHGRLPARQRTPVHRRIVGQPLIGNLGHNFAVLEHAQLVAGCNFADFDRIQSPLLENAEDFVFAAFLRYQQHALLRLAEHDFVGGHASFALRHAVEFDLDAHMTARAHLASRTRKSCRAHILNADNGSGLHGFETSFEQQLLQKRIADLHVGTLRLRSLAEFFAGHGGAVNAVASGLGSDIDHRIALTRRARVENLIFTHQSQRERVDQRIARVAGLELRFAT